MTKDIAHIIDRRAGRGCWPPADPYSANPVVWARAYLRSFDWLRPARTAMWFSNAMAATADTSVYDDPEDGD